MPQTESDRFSGCKTQSRIAFLMSFLADCILYDTSRQVCLVGAL